MKLLSSILILFVFVLPAYSQTAATSAATVTDFEINGLKVIFKQRSSSPTVSAGLFVRGGVRNQTAQNAGIESLTLAVAAESSKKYPREVLRKELSRTGSVIGAGAGFDFGAFSLTSTSRHFAESWNIFTDVVLNPSFSPDDVERIKNLMLVGLRNEGVSPDGALNALEAKMIYAGHAYANSPSGTIETISKLTDADLRAYHQKLLQTSRLLLVIVGDADPVEIKKTVTASFGRIPKGDYSETQIQRLAFAQPTLDMTARSLNTNYIKGVFAAPSLGDPDYYAMRVAMVILQSRVYDEVRTKRNLSYAPNAEMSVLGANKAEIYVTTADANQSVRIMLGEIEKLKTQSLSDEEVEGVPGFFLTTYYIDQETNASQAAELARYELIGGGWRNSLKFLEGIRGVRPAEIQAAANKYMKNIRFVVLGDPNAVDKTVFIKN